MSLIYLATPYTHFPDGLQAAFKAAARVTADLMKRGFVVYSPICHSHPVAETGLLNAVDHELWMRIDRVMMDRCDLLAVAKLPTWDSSKGVAYEIEYFRAHGKPVCYLDVPVHDRDAAKCQSTSGLTSRDSTDGFTQPPNCSPGVSESAKRRASDALFDATPDELGAAAVAAAHPMAAEALRMVDEQPCNQPRPFGESAWAVTWPGYQTLVGN